MIEAFVKKSAQMLANHPEVIEVECNQINDSYCEITIYADRGDVGKIIGKEGRMIGAIKTIISGCKAKDGVSYKINVLPKD